MKEDLLQENSVPPAAKAAFYLGVGSIGALVLALVAGIFCASLGVLPLFRSIVTPLSLAAIVFGLLARKKIAEEGLQGQREARLGLLLGVASLGLVVLATLLSLIIFIPFLFYSQ